MKIIVKQIDEKNWEYSCADCGWSKTYPFPDLRNPKCQCVPRPPSLITQAANVTKATAQHIRAGSPTCTDEQVQERFAICQACPRFIPGKDDGIGQCSLCGCGLRTVGRENVAFNKLRWAEQQCPEEPPRWRAIQKV